MKKNKKRPDNPFCICFQGELLAQFDDQGIDMVKHERLVVSIMSYRKVYGLYNKLGQVGDNWGWVGLGLR